MADRITDIEDGTFDNEVIKSELPVVADFYADWCGPCRVVEPIFERLAHEYGGRAKFVRINTDLNQELAVRYDVMSIPTLMVFRKGQVVSRMVGAARESDYRRLLDSVIGDHA
jgi:thioredoxin 1